MLRPGVRRVSWSFANLVLVHAVVAAWSFASPARAADAGAGTPGNIFNFGANARALALGGAYTAIAQDASSVYYNPAGLGTLPQRQLGLMHADLFEGFSYDYLGFAQPAFGGGIGLELLRLGVSGVDGRDAFNQPTGSFGYAETGLGLGFGYRGLLDGRLSAGASAKLLQRSLAGSSNRLAGLDLGLQYNPLFWGRRLQLGLVAQNALTKAMGDTSDRLPLVVKSGAAWALLPTFHLVAEVASDGTVAAGTEYAWRAATLRVGFQQQGVSFGGGLALWNRFQLDYAVASQQGLGISNRLSLGWKLGGEKRQEEDVRSRAHRTLNAAMVALRGQNYMEAARLFDQALNLDPSLEYSPEAAMGSRLKDLIKDLQLLENPRRQEELSLPNEANHNAFLAIQAYLQSQERKALLFAQAALGESYPQAESLQALVRVLETRTGRKVARDEILPLEDLVRVKKQKIMDAFYAERFQQAFQQCEDLVELTPEDALAWTRLGSLAFAMGETDKAREAYHKALELNPNNKQVARFMQLKGWK